MSAIEILSAFFLLSGASFAVLGAIGINRFDNVFARMHAQTKPVTLGLLLIALGTVLQLSKTGDIFKIGLAVLLQFITAPLGMHVLGRSAYSNDEYPTPPAESDELKNAPSEDDRA